MSKWTEGAEGFICPYCLVSFASSNKLQAHFIDFHSNEGSDAAVVFEPQSSTEECDIVEDPLGHYWKSVCLSKPCSCEVCKEIIWSSSLTCQECQMVIHVENCQEQVTKVCSESVNSKSPELTSSSSSYNSSEDRRDSRVDPPPPAKGIHGIVKRQVAKGRQRYVDDEFDLDLSYITDRVIAMSFPASGVESAYRNNLKDVAKMLKSRHDENYMIFNLSERSYDISRFNNQVLDFGWPDHLAPSLERLSIVCKSMKSWLDSDPQHVVVVHCKGGKGRTGCVIAAFMHYSKICHTADDALDHFAMKRFYDDKLQGVTQPSQRRYVHFFEDMLAGKVTLDSPPIKLSYVIIHGVPNFDGKGGCRPFLKVYQNMELIHTSGLYVCTADKERIKISLYGGLKLEGEILIKCFHKRNHAGVDSIFRCQFHHAVISEYRQVYGKSDLDDSFKDKRFTDNIKVELIFERMSDKPQKKKDVKVEADWSDIRHSLLADRSVGLPTPSEKRNSYAYFRGGYDHGKPEGEIPDMIELNPSVEKKERSVTSESAHMDPQLIERVEADDGNIYTVVSKVNGDILPKKSPKARPKNPKNTEISSVGSQKYSHLVHHQNPGKQLLHSTPQKPMRPPPPKFGNYSELSKSRKSAYDDVEGKQLVLTPVEKRESEPDSEVWMAVKWQTLPQERRDSSVSSQRSSSQTALDDLNLVDVYSNISDIATGNVFIPQQRRHSFTEGDSSIIITTPNQTDNSDERNGEIDGPIYTNEVEAIYTLPPDAEDDYSVVMDDDYVNAGAESLQPPEYENREEVRERMLKEEELKPATVITKELPPSNVKDMIMEGLKLKKPETFTVIQSSSLTQSEKKQTLGMFNFVDAQSSRLQVGRGDYAHFSVDSWKDSKKVVQVTRPPPPTRPPNRLKKTPSPIEPKPKLPHSSASSDSSVSSSRPFPRSPPSVSERPKGFFRPHRPTSNVKSQSSVDKPGPAQLHPSQSPGAKKPLLPTPSNDAKSRPSPPPKPAPYQPAKSTPIASVSEVKDLMPLWYRPNITRDEAILLVKTMSPGSFIVRDSQTVSGGYAITIKVDKDLVRQRKRLDETIEVTEDMCVNHFLIQPDPEGVKLQGWSETAFKTLPDFISTHTTEKLCLPCLLRLPKRDSRPAVKRKPVENTSQALVQGAACDFIFLGTIDVSSPVGDGVIGDAVQQLKALDLPVMTIVNFKASSNRVTVTDTVNGLPNKRSYPISTITHCGLDPSDTRWDAPLLGEGVRNKPCFGFIHRMQGSPGYVCLLFAELDSQHPVSNVVGYMKRLLKK